MKKYSDIPDFVRDDIIQEIMNQSKNCLLGESKAEGYVLIPVQFRGKLYTCSLTTWLCKMCVKYEARNTLSYLVNKALDKIIEEIVEDIINDNNNE